MSKTDPVDKALPRVLTVTPDPACGDRLGAALAEAAAVCSAASGAEARQALDEAAPPFDVVLLDLAVLRAADENLLEWICVAHPRSAVIVLAEDEPEETIMRCLALGADDALHKPIEARALQRTLRLALKRRGQAQSGAGLAVDNPTPGWVELTAPSAFEHLRRMQRFSQVLFTSRLPEKVCDDLRMAMEEVGRNAIEWGNKMDLDKQVRISYCIFEDRIVLKFEDEGEGFHPDEIEDPTNDLQGHQKRRRESGKRPGGLGLHLIRQIMDEVVYSDRGNVVIMSRFFR